MRLINLYGIRHFKIDNLSIHFPYITIELYMENTSYFIKDKALFGSYPTQDAVYELEKEGVRYFIDLTEDGEKKLEKYTTQYKYIRYPIRDQKVPSNWRKFSGFILKLCNTITNLSGDDKVYVHCKGGHGRSGIVVACTLCSLLNISPQDALDLTAKYHNNRKNMRDKWRTLGSPQSFHQKNFVVKFFKPVYFYKAYKTGISVGLSNFSLHPIETELGKFPTAEAAFQAYKDPNNTEYIQKQINSKTPAMSKYYGRHCNIRKDWNEQACKLLYNVLECKFQQNSDIKENLLNTGLRILIMHTKYDSYWGDGGDNSGQNQYGKILSKLRNNIYLSLYQDD